MKPVLRSTMRSLRRHACVGALFAAVLLIPAAFAQDAQKAQNAAPATEGGALADLTDAFNGWRHSGLTNEGERFVAAYPRPPVDRGEQRFRTLIEGRLKHFDKKARKPPTLVVNGTPTPLYTDDEGNFARPWAFGAGSNSLEIISADGKTHQRMQFYEADTSKPQAKLRAIVTWDDPHAQVDLHVITPDGLHAFFANPTLSDGSGFDVDSVDGAGPGIFSSAAPEHGTWLFFLNYWGNFDSTGYNFDATAHDRDVITARLTLVFNENTPNERRETMVVPLRKIGDLQLVKSERL
ncbi:YfaP family protein [Paraburkholderia megapolitana]|uniref:YfaP family protein n=1 Tax=Paraburkholderia megapolitana TaxID=420953 RepID=UPI0038B908D9